MSKEEKGDKGKLFTFDELRSRYKEMVEKRNINNPPSWTEMELMGVNLNCLPKEYMTRRLQDVELTGNKTSNE